jgi:hypothetical protein
LNRGETYQTDPEKPQWCPEYFYCPAGTSEPQPCADGTWTPWVGAKDASECIPCERGNFCRFTAMIAEQAAQFTEVSHYQNPATTLGPVVFTEYFGPCTAGFICLEGTPANPTGANDVESAFACPMGHYCTGADVVPIPCEYGTYQDSEQSSECKPCPEGSYCGRRGLESATICPQGHFCVAGSTYPEPCPAGTFSD